MKSLFFSVLLIGCSFQSFSQEYQDDCLDNLEIPSSYTPNGDGINEGWSIEFPCPPEEFKVTIFNRWGEEIYQSEDHQFIFDGADSKGRQVEAGVYLYTLTYTFNGGEFKKTGNFSVLR